MIRRHLDNAALVRTDEGGVALDMLPPSTYVRQPLPRPAPRTRTARSACPAMPRDVCSCALAALEAAWREAEEIAHIADALPGDPGK